MRRLLIILCLLSSPCWATWTFVQTATTATCTSTSNTCAVSGLATLGAGHVVIVIMDITLSATISSVSDGAGSTWNLCPTSECHNGTLSAKQIDMAYTINELGATATITVTRSNSTSATWRVRAYEFAPTGSVSYDKGGNSASSSATTAPPGVALTLSGSNDVIVQAIFGGTVTAIDGAYNGNGTFSTNFAWAYALNTTTGTAPTWTQASTTAAVAAIAIKETTAAAKIKSSSQWY